MSFYYGDGGTGFTAAQAHRTALQVSRVDEVAVQDMLLNDLREEIRDAAERGLFTLDYHVVGVYGIPLKKVKRILADILRKDNYTVDVRRAFLRISWQTGDGSVFF